MKKCAVFVLNGDVWERRSALKDEPGELFHFMNNDLHGFPDREILAGPEKIIGEKSLPQQFLMELLRKDKKDKDKVHLVANEPRAAMVPRSEPSKKPSKPSVSRTAPHQLQQAPRPRRNFTTFVRRPGL